jgi:pimeloyl-ACP methyl ester carboxylesterase
MAQMIDIGDATLWTEVTGEGDPVLQIHGSGFGHFNFTPVTPILAERFKVIDYDQRGYGASDHTDQEYSIESWADDAVKLLDALGVEKAHVHGTSMGGMVAQALAGKYPERVQSVVINCSAAKLGRNGRLVFKNWIDIASMDPAGPGSRILAELISWQCFSPAYFESPEAEGAIDSVQQILTDSNTLPVFVKACQAMIDMDLRDWVRKITAPALVLGGDVDLMTPWDQGPKGAGQQWIADNLKNGERYLIHGGGHSTPFDSTAEHCRVVIDFFARHPVSTAVAAA